MVSAVVVLGAATIHFGCKDVVAYFSEAWNDFTVDVESAGDEMSHLSNK